MTGKAKAVKGSSQGLDYLLHDKGHAIEIQRNGLIGNNGTEMFREFKMMTPNHPTKNLALSIVVSPHKIYTKDFKESDWQELCTAVIDKLKLQYHQYLCALHASRTTKHLHIYANRISSTGSCYSDKFLAFKMQAAYDAICKERGWYNAKEINKHLTTVEKKDALKVISEEIRNPKNTSIQLLEASMLKRGYELQLTKNSSGYIGGRVIPFDAKHDTTSKLENLTAKDGFKFSELDKNLRIDTILNAIEANNRASPENSIEEVHDEKTTAKAEFLDQKNNQSIVEAGISLFEGFGAGANDQDDEQKLKRKKKQYRR